MFPQAIKHQPALILHEKHFPVGKIRSSESYLQSVDSCNVAWLTTFIIKHNTPFSLMDMLKDMKNVHITLHMEKRFTIHNWDIIIEQYVICLFLHLFPFPFSFSNFPYYFTFIVHTHTHTLFFHILISIHYTFILYLLINMNVSTSFSFILLVSFSH